MSGLIFRKEALQRLRSPEQLDELMTVTSARGWLALLASIILISAGISWAFLARIPLRVEGFGILLYKGNLTEIVADTNGMLVAQLVHDGDVVTPGQVLMRLKVPELEDQIRATRAEWESVKTAQLGARLRFEEERLERVSQVRSPVDGVVMEILSSPISNVSAGEPLLIVSPKGSNTKDLRANLFVSAVEGKRIRDGMKGELVPLGVQEDQNGHMLGKVSFVATLPTSERALKSILKLPEMVKYVEQEIPVAPFLVFVDLTSDLQNPTGYAWTSKPPSQPIQPGTLTRAFITVGEARPIDFVMPIFTRRIWGD